MCKKQRFLRAGSVIVLGLSIILSGCGSNSSSTSGGNNGGNSNTKEYTIGMNITLSGASADYGKSYQNGANLAVEEINKAGGINGANLKLQIDDNAGNPSQATAIFHRTSQQIQAEIVGISGPIVLAVMPLGEQAKIPMLAPGVATVGVTAQGNKYVFRLQLNDRDSMSALIGYFAKDKGYTRIAIIHDVSDYGVSGRDNAVKAMEALGLKPVADESFKGGDTDFSSQLLKIKSLPEQPQAVLVWGMAESSLIVKQMHSLGMKSDVVGGAPLDTDTYPRLAGADAEGSVFASSYFANMSDAKIKKFNDDYLAKYGKNPDSLAANSYDALYVIAQGLKSAGGEGAALRDAISKVNSNGVNGSFSFLPSGDNNRSIKIEQWKNGSRVLLKEVPVK